MSDPTVVLVLTSYEVPQILLLKLCLLLGLGSNSLGVCTSQAGYLRQGGQLGAGDAHAGQARGCQGGDVGGVGSQAGQVRWTKATRILNLLGRYRIILQIGTFYKDSNIVK